MDYPQVLASVTADLPALWSRQRKMLVWWDHLKMRSADELQRTASLMRAGLWSHKTTCVPVPLSGLQTLEQTAALKAYWRQPQGYVDGVWSWYGIDAAPELENSLLYPTCGMTSVSASGEEVPEVEAACQQAIDEFVHEKCMSVVCAPPAIADLTCARAMPRYHIR